MRKGMGCLIAAIAAVVVLGLYAMGLYNGLVESQQRVEEQWSQVENAYQRRADLIPNLVNTVKGAANFERGTLNEVVSARARVGQLTVTPEVLDDPRRFAQFEQAQNGLSSALSRLLAVVENYPQLRSVEGFTNLMVQLEGTENRIAVERRNFNQAAREYNTRIRRFPATLFAGMMGFEPRPYFQAAPGAETAPRVDFGQ